jgi:glycosyltransferase involved in cell wall biosynthesis
VLASRLPEIERIVKTYNIGTFIENHDPSHIAEKLNELLCSPRLSEYRKNTQKAKEELTWEKEKFILKTVIQSALQN